MSSQSRVAPTRRTVLRAAAWTAPAVSIAVAAPAFAASPVASCNMRGTRNGANFDVTITCSGTITSVQVGSAPAIFNGTVYRAQLSGNARSEQTVLVKTSLGDVEESIRFIGK